MGTYAGALWKSYLLTALSFALLFHAFLGLLSTTIAPLIYNKDAKVAEQLLAQHLAEHWGYALLLFVAFCAWVAALFWAHRQSQSALAAIPNALFPVATASSIGKQRLGFSGRVLLFLIWAWVLLIVVLPLVQAIAVAIYTALPSLLPMPTPLPLTAQVLHACLAFWGMGLLLLMGLYMRLLKLCLTQLSAQ